MHDVVIVGLQFVLDRGEVGDRAAHADDCGGCRAPIEPLELGGDRRVQFPEPRPGGRLGEPVTLCKAHGTDVEAEALRDAVAGICRCWSSVNARYPSGNE